MRLRVRTIPTTILAVLLLLAFFTTATPGRDISVEYKIKAAYLFNFAKFVTWPPRAFSAPDAPYIIGIVGNDPFGDDLDETIRGKTVGGRPFVVHRIASPDAIGFCHILFISDSEARHIERIIEHLRTQPVLTVGEMDGFLKAGGMIRFVMANNNVRFEIAPGTARDVSLQVSSKLIQVAQSALSTP